MKDPSAKLGVLMEQLHAVIEEGHKALIFSQFTSLLAIVRASLESGGIEYEYLDGKTVAYPAHAVGGLFGHEARGQIFPR